jgi:hypothetical protein
MAKSDFCFTYYDGDAARDMSHMNRLERGAYTDLIISQRKFGHLTKEQIKKTLGNDFGSVWESISLVLKTDQNAKYYIEWLDNSEKKAKTHSKLQSDKRKGKTKQEPIKNQTEPNENKTQPLGDGSGYVDDIEENNKKEFDFSKPDIQGDELIFPIDTTAFRTLWASWKKYRWLQHGNRYGMMGEQADLKRLEKMDFQQAEKTILTAISNNWKNLYPEKNGKAVNGNSKAGNTNSTSEYLKQYYSNKAQQQ